MSGRNGEVGRVTRNKSIHLRSRLQADEAPDQTIDRKIISGGGDGGQYASSASEAARARVYGGPKASHHYD